MKYSGFHRALEIDHRAHHRDSWQIHLCSEIEADQLDGLRQKFLTSGQKPPSYTALVIKAIAMAVNELRPQYPELNSFLKRTLFGKSIHVFEGISAGCSVALDNEEAVAIGVVQEPQSKSLLEITAELGRMSDPQSTSVKNALTYYSLPGFIQNLLYQFAARAPKIRYETRGTFCLNPVGKFGVDYHLSLPQTSCLQFGMGVVRDRAVARNGTAIVVKTFNLTVSFDRRLMNGRPCAILMERIRSILNKAEFGD